MEVVSGLGDGVFWVGLIALLLDRGVGVRGFAVAAVVRLAPRAVLSAPAGGLADRVDRRRLLASLDGARALLMVVLAVIAADEGGVPIMLLAVLAAYTLAAPYRPALTAAMPLIAGEGGLSSANALVGTIRQVMTFIGPVFGAVIVHWSSSTIAFIVNGASFAVSALLVAGVAELSGAKRAGAGLTEHRATWTRELRGGWRAVTGTVGLPVIAVLVFSMYVVRGAELVLYALVAEHRLGLGTAGVGVLTGAVGLGALGALPIAGRIARNERSDLILPLAVATTAVPTAFLGLIRSPIVACAALLLVGVGLVTFEVATVMLLQRVAAREVLGRVFGVVGTASNAGKLFGALAGPAVVIAIGLPRTLVLTGVAVGCSGIATAPALRALNRTTRRRSDQHRPIVDALAALSVFEGASSVALEQLAIAISAERVEPGTVVVREGDQADDMFVIREGSFSVFHGGALINTMQPGDWFGEIGLLQRRPRTATVVASTPADVWRIPGDVFLSALEDLATEPAALIAVMADRLNRTSAEAPVTAHP